MAAVRWHSLRRPCKGIEVFRLCKLLCFRDACREVLPRHNAIDSCEGIGAVLFGFEQSLPNSPKSRSLSLVALPAAWNCF